MTPALGIVALLLGVLGVLGQLVSAIDFQLAQRLGLQEADAEADPLSRDLELATARWDLAVLWTLPLAGIAMLLDTSWWPWAALAAGAVAVDAGGREAVKGAALRAGGVRTGSEREVRIGLAFLAVMVALGLALVAHALVVLD